MMDAVLFYVFAALALGSALVVIGQRNPIYSAFSLIVTLISLSVIFGVLGSPFIAALQVIVYAGAIMVLFLFVLMLLNVKEEARDEGESGAFRGVAIALGVLLAGQVGAVLLALTRTPATSFDASTENVARVLFSAPHIYAFEATSILILAALVGAVVLAKRDL